MDLKHALNVKKFMTIKKLHNFAKKMSSGQSRPNEDRRARNTGMSVEALSTELAPLKNLNTEDYEYSRHLEETRRRNELLRKMEQEREINEFKKLRNMGAIKRTDLPIPVTVKPAISKEVSRLIKLKPKNK